MRIAIIVIAAFIVLAGAGCTVGGTVIAVAFGTDDRIETGDHRFDTATYALVSDAADLTDEGPGGGEINDRLEDIRVRIEAEPRNDGGDVFLAVGREADVDAYLDGVAHDIITDIDFDGFSLTKDPVPGTSEPDSPGDQSFWLERATGSGRQTLDWGVQTGESYRFVIMNADGSQGVDVDATLGAKIPHIFTIGIVLASIGFAFAVIGIIAIVLAARRSTPSAAPAPSAEP